LLHRSLPHRCFSTIIMANSKLWDKHQHALVSGDIVVGNQFVRSGCYLVNPPLEFGGYEVTTLLPTPPTIMETSCVSFLM